LLEASGSVTEERVEAIARTGVDRISVGAITHSALALDMALELELPGQQGGKARE
jgi:nicotinate-nucleotide pyrophosphorylase (carboxylating)